MNESLRELVLFPGEWYFGNDYIILRTLLGSCVAISVWHPILLYGGMCHYLLPASDKPDKKVPDARYGMDAMAFLSCAMAKIAPINEYHIGCFGGSDMFPVNTDKSVGQRNILSAQNWLEQNRLHWKRTDLGGSNGRKIALNMATGFIELSYLTKPSELEHYHDYKCTRG